MNRLLCLQWANHAGALSCKLHNLRIEETFCDATIICDWKYFPVHRLVLSSCSEYFEEIFKKTPCRHPFIVLKDVDVATIEYILEFIYKGDVKIPEDKLSSLLQTAETLKIKGLAVPDEFTPSKISDELLSGNLESEGNKESLLSTTREGLNVELVPSVASTPIKSFSSNEKPISGINVSSFKGSATDSKNVVEVIPSKGLPSISSKDSEAGSESTLPLEQFTGEETEATSKNTKYASEYASVTEKEKLKNLPVISEQEKSSVSEGKSKMQHLSCSNFNNVECKVVVPEKESESVKKILCEEVDLTESEVNENQENFFQWNIFFNKQDENFAGADLKENQVKVDVEEFIDDPNEICHVGVMCDETFSSNQITNLPKEESLDSFKRFKSYVAVSPEVVEISPLIDDDIKILSSQERLLQVPQKGSISKGKAMRHLKVNKANDEDVLGIISPDKIKKSIDSEKPFQCYVCSYRTKYRSALVKHVIIHTGKKPFKCSLCPYQSARKAHLKIHWLVHTGEKPFKCNICSSSFSQKSNFKIHMNIHLRQRQFKCHLCSYETNTNSSLKRHLRIHEGKIPFKCHLCAFGAQSKCDLKKHSRIHTGEKPYACAHCSYRASVKSSLTRHISLRHKNEILS